VVAASIPTSEGRHITTVNARSTIRKRPSEAGIALLISIFILLLISVVAIALIVASGTETSLAGNYRSATGVYYASLAGLEEARERVLPKDPNSFKNTAPANFLHSPGNTLAIGEVRYVLNPGPTENIANILAAYPDTEYDNEFGGGALAGVVAAGNRMTTASVWNRNPLNSLPVPGPLYKWVRINGITEQSLNLDVFPHDLVIDPKLVYYDGTNLNDTGSGSQVLEITSLAVLPNGSQKLLQYLAAPNPLNLPNFPAAISLAGNSANTLPANSLSYSGPNSASFNVDGADSFHNPFGSCTATATVYTGIGYTNTSDTSQANIKCCQVTGHPNNYLGTGGVKPNVLPVTMPPTLQTPDDYNKLVQAITQNADVILTPGSSTTPAPYTAYGSDLTAATAGMANTNPMTVVINGDLDLNAWNHTGYGLLLVTGNLNYDPDATWEGIVLVIGKGTFTGTKGGAGRFDGATLVAQTVDPGTGAPLASLGPASITFGAGMGGVGFYYSSCWIKNSLPTASYKILSFREISQ